MIILKKSIIDCYYKYRDLNEKMNFGESKFEFDTFYMPLKEFVKEILKRRNFYFLPKKKIINSLVNQFHVLADRVLIREINILRENGELIGNNSKEEYIYYLEKVLTIPQYIEKIFQQYSELLVVLVNTINRSLKFWAEMEKRICNDKCEIEYRLCENKKFAKIADIQGDNGDVHNSGRMVLILILDNNCKIVYKPHSVENETKYHKMINYLYKTYGIKGFSYDLIEKAHYGWCSFVKSETVPAEGKNFYFRVGMNLALAYVFGVSDLHYENMLIKREFPVFVDLESMVSYSKISEKKIKKTVLYTGILPTTISQSKNVRMDVSAIGLAKTQRHFLKSPVYKERKTSKIKVEYEYPVVNTGINTEGMLGKEKILEGFNVGYNIFLKDNDIKKTITDMKNNSTRVILRDTQQYHMILYTSYHPDAYKMGRYKFLNMAIKECSVKKSAIDKKIMQKEVEQLLKGDIPYFFCRINKRNLYVNRDDKIIKNYLYKTPINELWRRVKVLSIEDMKLQNEIIKQSLQVECETAESILNKNVMLSTESDYIFNAKEKKQKIIEQIMKKMYVENGEIQFLSSSLIGEDAIWSLYSVNNYLYNGVSGLAVFLAAYIKTDKNHYIIDIFNKVIKRLFNYTDGVHSKSNDLETRYTGIFEGESSICYAYQLLYRLTGEKKFIEYAKKHAIIVSDLLEQDSQFDIMYGNAGALIMYINLYRLLGDIKYLDTAEKIGDFLLKHIGKGEFGGSNEKSGKLSCGIAHGNSGFIMALSKLYGFSGQKKYLETIHKLSVNEIKLWNNEWHLREGESWCNGSLGMLLARNIGLSFIKINSHSIRTELIEQKVLLEKQLKKIRNRKAHCLCHGSCGNAMIIQEYIKKRSDQQNIDLEKISISIRRKLFKLLNEENISILFQEKNCVGLMTGITGIGYYLLRNECEDLPLILDLE